MFEESTLVAPICYPPPPIPMAGRQGDIGREATSAATAVFLQLHVLAQLSDKRIEEKITHNFFHFIKI